MKEVDSNDTTTRNGRLSSKSIQSNKETSIRRTKNIKESNRNNKPRGLKVKLLKHHIAICIKKNLKKVLTQMTHCVKIFNIDTNSKSKYIIKRQCVGL